MGSFPSWNLRRADENAKARSDEIDVNMEQKSKSFKRQRDVLLMSSTLYAYILIF
jgi:hypothetical protein